MSSHSHSHSKTSNGDGVPPRPKSPVDYVPTPYHKIAPTPANMLEQLKSEHQKGEATCVHNMSGERLRSVARLGPLPQSPSSTAHSNRSTNSFQSLARGVAKRLELGKMVFAKTRPAIETVVKKGKQAAAQRSKDSRKGDSRHTAGTSCRRSLYHEEVLPRLKIPDATKAAEEALGSACSTDTTRSPSWTIEGLSPTSLVLRGHACEEYPEDIIAEFRNMISARRRVRKSKFGQEVAEHCRARPEWNGRHPTSYPNDINQLRTIVAALQEQKDTAQNLAKVAPNRYKGFRSVDNPGCSNKHHWQNRSY